MSAKTLKKPAETRTVTAQELPLHCPLDSAPLWARHPRVYLDLTHGGSATCPYCNTEYVLTGEAPKGH